MSNEEFSYISKCESRSDAIEILKYYKRRSDDISDAFLLATSDSITDSDALVARQFSDALAFAIISLEEDCRAKREARRFKKKYLELKLAVVRTLHLMNDTALDPNKDNNEVLTSVVDCFQKNFSYLFKEPYDGGVD